MTTISGNYTVTAITVYTWGLTTNAVYHPDVDVSFDGGSNWEGVQEVALPLPPNDHGETSNTWSGLSYDQDDLALLQVKYIGYTDGKGQSAIIDRCYALITYTEAGWDTGKFLGVEYANISKVCGVSRTNIANIKGI